MSDSMMNGDYVRSLPNFGSGRPNNKERRPIRPNICEADRGYICPLCDLLLADGAAYDFCPSCENRVDYADVKKPVWACPTCDAMVNEARAEAPHCDACDRLLLCVHDPKKQRASKKKHGSLWTFCFSPKVLGGCWLLSLVPVVLLGSHPDFRSAALGLMGPLILLPVILSIVLILRFATNWKELYTLLCDQTTRVIHGLEHATLGILHEKGITILGGLTDEKSFDAYFDGDQDWRHKEKTIRRAFKDAVVALKGDKKELAFHHHCGTSLFVAWLLASLLALACGAIGMFMTLPFWVLLGILVVLGIVWSKGILPLSMLMQRHVTVSTDFKDARLVSIVRRGRDNGVLRYEIFVDVER